MQTYFFRAFNYLFCSLLLLFFTRSQHRKRFYKNEFSKNDHNFWNILGLHLCADISFIALNSRDEFSIFKQNVWVISIQFSVFLTAAQLLQQMLQSIDSALKTRKELLAAISMKGSLNHSIDYTPHCQSQSYFQRFISTDSILIRRSSNLPFTTPLILHHH